MQARMRLGAANDLGAIRPGRVSRFAVALVAFAALLLAEAMLATPAAAAGDDGESALQTIRRAERRALEGDGEAARGELAARCTSSPSDADARLALASIEPDPAARLRLLEEAEKLGPNRELTLGLLAQHYLALGRPQDAARLLARCPSPARQAAVTLARARASVLRGEVDDAIRLLEEHHAGNPDPALVAELGALAQPGGKPEPAAAAQAQAEWLSASVRNCFRFELRDARLMAARGLATLPVGPGDAADAERYSLVQALAADCLGDPEALLGAGRACWTGWRRERSMARTLLQTAVVGAPDRLDVKVWSGILDLGSYEGDAGRGFDRLQTLPESPSTACGPALLEMARVARGLHFYMVRDFPAAARELGACGATLGWYHGLFLADSLAASGRLAQARRVAAAWSGLVWNEFQSCSELASRLGLALETGDTGRRAPSLEEDFCGTWFHRVDLDDSSIGGAYPTVAVWIRSLERSGHFDQVRSAFAGNLGNRFDSRDLLAKFLGDELTSKLPPIPPGARTRLGLIEGPRPTAPSRPDPFTGAGPPVPAAAPLAPQAPPPRDRLALALGAAFGLALLALLLAPKTTDRARRARLAGLAVALGLAAGFRLMLAPEAARDTAAATSGRPAWPSRDAPGLVGPPSDGGPTTPPEESGRLLQAAEVPLPSIVVPADFHAAMTQLGFEPPEMRPAAGQELLVRFDRLDREARAGLLLRGDREAYPYLMQRLARGDLVEQEMAAGLLAQVNDARALALLRRAALDHVTDDLRSNLTRLPLGRLLGFGPPGIGPSVHRAGCRVLRAVAEMGDRDSIPLLLDAFEADTPGLVREARRAMVKLTGAIGPRWASQWRSVQASREFRGRR